MNRLLHFVLKILNAHAQPVEPEPPQSFQMRAAGHARIDFDSDLGVRSERKPLACVSEEVFHLRRSQIRGSSATPVKLNHTAFLRNPTANVLDFLLQRREIRNRYALVFLNRNVARAKQAQVLAKRQVHIK